MQSGFSFIWPSLLLLCGAVACGGEHQRSRDTGSEDASEKRQLTPLGSADHHMHILSATLAEHFDRLGEVLGEGGEPASVRSAADAIRALDAAGLEGGVVLSGAYMFGAPDLPVDDEASKVRAENLYVAEQVSRYPERLVALCSLNPLADYAIAEVELCAADERVGGLKLHLANSAVDLRDNEHVGVLAALFRRAHGLDLPVLIHMRTRNQSYGAEDARVFIDQVLSQAPGLPVQVAHLAGWGGYDPATDAALGAFAEALAEGRAEREQLTFGLGAVVFLAALAPDEEQKETVRNNNTMIGSRMREIGLDRFVYATDWPSWPPGAEADTSIARNIELLRSELSLSEVEMDQVLANVGPVLSYRASRPE